MKTNWVVTNAVRSVESGLNTIVTVGKYNFEAVSKEITRRLVAKNLDPNVVLYDIKK